MNKKRQTSILKHLALMAAISVLILIGVIWGLKSYTRHQINVQVPSVQGKSVDEAIRLLEASDLRYEVIDSVYDRTQMPGTVAEVIPIEGASVKPGRIIFIKCYSSSAMRYAVPYVKDISVRQARALLRGMGFEQISERIVPGEHLDLCVGLELAGGRPLVAGTMIPKDTPIVILVTGSVSDSLSVVDLLEDYEASPTDSLPKRAADSLAKPKPTPTNTPDDWW